MVLCDAVRREPPLCSQLPLIEVPHQRCDAQEPAGSDARLGYSWSEPKPPEFCFALHGNTFPADPKHCLPILCRATRYAQVGIQPVPRVSVASARWNQRACGQGHPSDPTPTHTHTHAHTRTHAHAHAHAHTHTHTHAHTHAHARAQTSSRFAWPLLEAGSH